MLLKSNKNQYINIDKSLTKKSVKSLLEKNPTISFDEILKEIVSSPEERHHTRLKKILKSLGVQL